MTSGTVAMPPALGRMSGTMPVESMRLLRYAGFVVWVLAGLPLCVRLTQDPSLLDRPRYWLWLVCFAVFGAAFALTGWQAWSTRWRRLQIASLIVQTVAPLVMIRLVCSGLEGSLLVIVAAQLGWVLPLGQALLWVLVQAAVMCAILPFSVGAPITLLLVSTYLGFQVLALFSCFLTARETTARADLARTNRELGATRELLANTSRLAERERISRELHDTLGHHLTALSLNLEAASHLADEATRPQVQRAQAVTKVLLADVRGAVGALRGEDAVGLAHALRTLVETVPEPRIHLTAPDDLVIADPLHAHTLLRCVQEIVTNTIRHAHATNLWIALVASNGEITLRARDDGRGAKEVHAGHGLAGMRERLDLVGGRLEVHSQPARGFHVHVSIPVPGGAT
ncbi:MAG: sensor histidine kinase [Luteitalea sp.]|nr:sensor histidine kinase [Luteitalea sp.]